MAIQAWGVARGDRYLLDLRVGQMNYNQARRAILEQAALRPEGASACGASHPDRERRLRRRTDRGAQTRDHRHQEDDAGAEGDKILRAESAASDLESGNCFLPGYRMGQDELAMPDESRTPADILGFIDECAMFPNGRYDDQVDAWSQGMNWLRKRMLRSAKVYSSFAGT